MIRESIVVTWTRKCGHPWAATIKHVMSYGGATLRQHAALTKEYGAREFFKVLERVLCNTDAATAFRIRALQIFNHKEAEKLHASAPLREKKGGAE